MALLILNNIPDGQEGFTLPVSCIKVPVQRGGKGMSLLHSLTELGLHLADTLQGVNYPNYISIVYLIQAALSEAAVYSRHPAQQIQTCGP